MKKVTKRLLMGALAVLMLFGGLATPALASEYIGIDPMCITGGPANTAFYRVNTDNRYRVLNRDGELVLGGTGPLNVITAGTIVTRPNGSPANRTVNGFTYRQVNNAPARGNIWIRVAFLTPINTC